VTGRHSNQLSYTRAFLWFAAICGEEGDLYACNWRVKRQLP